MNQIPISEKNRLMQGGTIVQKVVASQPQNIKWISIENLSKKKIKAIAELERHRGRLFDESTYQERLLKIEREYSHMYKITELEIDSRNYDASEGITSQEIVFEKNHFAGSVAQLYELFLKLNVDPGKFGPTWSCEYPFG
jgi:hypothetical protein